MLAGWLTKQAPGKGKREQGKGFSEASVIYAVGRHMQVLMETAESMARRELKPRARRKYWLGCTCRGYRYPNGHCQHTLAIFESEIKPNRWRDVAPQEMKAKSAPSHLEAPRIELEREVLALRELAATVEHVLGNGRQGKQSRLRLKDALKRARDKERATNDEAEEER